MDKKCVAVAIEGTDLIGKSTTTTELGRCLKAKVVHFPGANPIGTFIRQWRKTVQSEPNDVLYLAEMVMSAILDEGVNTVYDRHFLSTPVYSDLERTSILKAWPYLERLFTNLLHHRIYYIVLHASEELLTQRYKDVNRDRDDYYHKIQSILEHNERFQTFAKMLGIPIIEVDGKTPKQIVDEIVRLLNLNTPINKNT